MADKKPKSNEAKPENNEAKPESNEAKPLPPVFPIPLPIAGSNISIYEQLTAVTFRHYTVNFLGTQLIQVYVTADPFVADCWVSETRHRHLHLHYNHLPHLVAGFPVQWNPVPTTTGRLVRQPGTLQICVGQCCLIYQLAHAASVPGLLREFLKTTTLVGLYEANVARMLWESHHQLQIRMPLDITSFVKKENGDNFSGSRMGEIAHFCLGFEGFRVDREISKSDWSARVLSPVQVRQACVKAYVSCLIDVKCNAWKIGNGLLYPIPRI